MQFKRIETPGIAHYAYVIADGNVAAVVDPQRHIDEYLQAARDMGASIRYIFETHRQEDFVMGSAWLAKNTGAKIVNGSHELFGHGDKRLVDGDTVKLGGLTIRALHTPGHTPESMSYAVYKNADEESAWCIFTGDTLFFGDTGRTDLSEESKSAENAGKLYDSVHDKLAGLGDTALIFPAHGPGSVCGSGMAELPFSTLGAEKKYNKVFVQSRAQFMDSKAGERLSRPPYFRLMEKVNLNGGLEPVLGRGTVQLLDLETFKTNAEGQFRFDTREPESFAGGHIKDTYNIWLDGLPVFGGWIADSEAAVYLVTDRDEDVDRATLHLSQIGIDNVQGALTGGFGTWRKSGEDIERSGIILPSELANHLQDEKLSMQLIDVRDEDEFLKGHIPGAVNLNLGDLVNSFDQLNLNKNQPVVVNCSVGHRAGLGVSLLKLEGFADVRNLLGGLQAWQKQDLPIKTEDGAD